MNSKRLGDGDGDVSRERGWDGWDGWMLLSESEGRKGKEKGVTLGEKGGKRREERVVFEYPCFL